MSSDESEYTRQEQIWGGLYGPPQAVELLAQARDYRAEHPEMDIREVFKAVEPSDEDDDPDEAGLARPGVG
jgi:hypothetical protein